MNRTPHLCDELARYQPVDSDDRRHLTAMLDLVATRPDSAVGPDVFARDSYAPGHFTASAFVLSPGEDALLLILHAKLDLWLQPGGHVDPDDADLVAAARREASEEAGLADLSLVTRGIFDVDVHSIPARHDAPEHRHFDVRYLFRASSLRVAAASDAKAARWVALADLESVQSDASVMRAVRRIRATIAR